MTEELVSRLRSRVWQPGLPWESELSMHLRKTDGVIFGQRRLGCLSMALRRAQSGPLA